jgi:hypothetical protein
MKKSYFYLISEETFPPQNIGRYNIFSKLGNIIGSSMKKSENKNFKNVNINLNVENSCRSSFLLLF